MADVGGPNWKVEQLKLHIGIQDLTTRLIRSQLEITEAEHRIAISEDNIKATHKAIADGQKRLRELIKEHGDLVNG